MSEGDDVDRLGTIKAVAQSFLKVTAQIVLIVRVVHIRKVE